MPLPRPVGSMYLYSAKLATATQPMLYHASGRRPSGGLVVALVGVLVLLVTGGVLTFVSFTGSAAHTSAPAFARGPSLSATNLLTPASPRGGLAHIPSAALQWSTQRSSPTVPSAGFSGARLLSTTTSTDWNGGPDVAASNNPSTISTSSGAVYTTWSAEVSGVWRIYFSSSLDGITFTTPVAVDPSPSATTPHIQPRMAISGSSIAIVYQTAIGYDGYGGYALLLSTNAGSSWPASPTGTSSSASGYIGGAWDNVLDPTVAFDAQGDILVGFWGCDSGAFTCTGTYAGTVSDWAVDVYTGAGAYSTSYGTDPFSGSQYVGGGVDLACSTASGGGCGLLLSWTNTANTLMQAFMLGSTSEFSADTQTTLTTGAFSATGAIGISITHGEVAYSAASSALSVVEANIGTATSPTYAVKVFTTTNDWTTATASPTSPQSTPAASSEATIAAGPNGAPFVTWIDASGAVEVTWSPNYPTSGWTYLTAQTAASSPSSATTIGVTTAVAPFRVDLVYIQNSSSANVYYTNFTGLSATASATPTAVDLWNNVQFNAAPVAGATPYLFSWNFGGACSPSCPTTTQNPLVNYTNAGTYTVSVQVTDSFGEVVTVSAGSITVNPLLLTALSPANSTIDVTQSLTFTATASGGSGTYGASAYAWQVNGAAQAGSTASTFTHTFAAAGAYSVAADVTDSLGFTSRWAYAVVLVNAPLTVGAITASPNPALTGHAVGFSASVSGGTPTLAYSWWLGFGQKSTTASPTMTYTTAGNVTVYLNVTDGASMTAGSTALVMIDSPMTLTPTAGPANPQAGQGVFFNVSIAGGSGKYVVFWAPGDGSAPVQGLGTNYGAMHAYSAAGTYAARVWVNDSLGLSATAIVNVTVIAPISVVSVLGAPNPTNTTTMVSMTATITGGIGPFTYLWNYGDGTPAGSGTWTHHNYTTAGTYAVKFTVTDAAAHSATKGFNEVVNPAQGGCGSSCTLAISMTFSPASPVAGLQVAFRAGASGGSGQYTSYAWAFGDGAKTTTTGPSTAHTYTTQGAYQATVTVTDSAGNTGQGSATVNVLPAPSGLYPSVTANPSEADAGQAVTFTASAIGGTGSYTSFTFNFGDGSSPVTVTTTPTVVLHAFSAPATYDVTVTVVDSSGTSATSAPTPVLVEPGMTVQVTADQGAYDSGVYGIFRATATGGTGSFGSSVLWTFGAGSSPLSGSAREGHTFNTTVQETVMIEATMQDTLVGASANGYLNVTVYPAISVGITGDPYDAPAPAYVNLTVTITGGGEPYTLVWNFGDGTHVTVQSTSGTYTIMHKYTSPGGFEASVAVTDGYKGSALGIYNGTVGAPKSSVMPGTIAGIPWWIFAVLAALVLGIVVLVAVLRRRKPRGSGDELEAFGAPVGAMVVAPAAAATVLPDMVAPAVPIGSSDMSPDELGGVLPSEPSALPSGSRVGESAPTLTPAREAPSADLAPVAEIEAATVGPARCPRCGTVLLGAGLPCPNCNYVASTEELDGRPPPFGAPAPEAVAAAPAPPPSSVEKLTHCPQCSGPLSPEGECPVCQVRWEPTPEGLTTAPGMSAPSGPVTLASTPAATELTNCPQCGGPLAPGRVCPTCQVSWEPSSSSPPGLLDRPEAESRTPRLPPTSSLAHPPPPDDGYVVPPAPVVTEVPRAGAPEVAQAPSAPPPVVAPAPSPAQNERLPPAAAPPLPPPTPAPPAAAPEALSPQPAHGSGRCFICSGPLDHGYCSACNMNWAGEGG